MIPLPVAIVALVLLAAAEVALLAWFARRGVWRVLWWTRGWGPVRRRRLDAGLRRLETDGLINDMVRMRIPTGVVELDEGQLRSALLAERAQRGAGRLIVDRLAVRQAGSLVATRPVGTVVVARPREARPGRRRRTAKRAGPDDDSGSDGEGPHVGRRRRGAAS